MSLDTQEQLAKGNKACDMQYRGWREVVQLEAIELQEPPGETDVLEIRVLLSDKRQSIPALLWKDRGRSPLSFRPYRWRVRLEPEP